MKDIYLKLYLGCRDVRKDNFSGVEMSSMAEKDEYISLKEAAEMTGYTPDYIGQLIRSGKISGKQVYLNVAWMTTREALIDYIENKTRKPKETTFVERAQSAILSPHTLVRIYTFVAWGISGLLVVAILGIGYIFAVSIDHEISARNLQKIQYAKQ
jgi:hypothetical protein